MNNLLRIDQNISYWKLFGSPAFQFSYVTGFPVDIQKNLPSSAWSVPEVQKCSCPIPITSKVSKSSIFIIASIRGQSVKLILASTQIFGTAFETHWNVAGGFILIITHQYQNDLVLNTADSVIFIFLIHWLSKDYYTW